MLLTSNLRAHRLPFFILQDLFSQIGTVRRVQIIFDRAGRSNGIAYVTYEDAGSVAAAIREFDGANAKGQPITLTAVPLGKDRRAAGGDRNGDRASPFPMPSTSSRSLFDRIRSSDNDSGSEDRRRRRPRSASPDRRGGSARYDSDRERDRDRDRDRDRSPRRRSDTTKPAPSGIDRYVPPSSTSNGASSPRRRRAQSSDRPVRAYDDSRREREPRGRGYEDRQQRGAPPGGRRGGRDGGRGAPERGGGGGSGALGRDGRVRKTAEELDAEMDGYFKAEGAGAGAGAGAGNGVSNGGPKAGQAHAQADGWGVEGQGDGDGDAPRVLDNGDVDMVL